MMTLMDQQQRLLLKNFTHCVGRQELTTTKSAQWWRVSDTTVAGSYLYQELVTLCNNLTLSMRPDLVQLDKYRKRLIRSIFAWREALGEKATMNYVKAIACQAARLKKGFNSIPLERLRSLYNAFPTKKRRIWQWWNN